LTIFVDQPRRMKAQDRPPRNAAAVTADQLWYKDAIIYQLHVRSFFDSNDDGIGDFPGLISRLDYIGDLGVNAIWLLPFYPSPRLDEGYDVSAYRDVRPDYGTLSDFRQFVRAAHARVSFPKIPSEQIRAVRQNQRIIGGDACDPPIAWDVCRQPVLVVAPA
jgi:1,4-alpha-glucan branching enzyme